MDSAFYQLCQKRHRLTDSKPQWQNILRFPSPAEKPLNILNEEDFQEKGVRRKKLLCNCVFLRCKYLCELKQIGRDSSRDGWTLASCNHICYFIDVAKLNHGVNETTV